MEADVLGPGSESGIPHWAPIMCQRAYCPRQVLLQAGIETSQASELYLAIVHGIR